MNVKANKNENANPRGPGLRSRMNPAVKAPRLDKRLDAAACSPKKVAKKSGGITLPIIFCQALAAKPAPIPCQIKARNVKIKPAVVPISGNVQAITARARKGTLSLIVLIMTNGFRTAIRLIFFDVKSWGSCQPIL